MSYKERIKAIDENDELDSIEKSVLKSKESSNHIFKNFFAIPFGFLIISNIICYLFDLLYYSELDKVNGNYFFFDSCIILVGYFLFGVVVLYFDKVKINRFKSVTPVNIVDDKKAKSLDTNNDGKIQIGEIYTKSEDEIIKDILSHDGNFSDIQFKSWINNVFINYLNAWSTNDLELIRKYESNSLYLSDSLKIKENISNGVVNKYDGINLRGSLIKDYKIEGNNQVIVVAVSCKIKNYIYDTQKNRIVDGSDKESFKSYLLTFSRNINVMSDYSIDISRTCPNCGANVKLNDTGCCSYCDSSITSGKYDWCLIEFKNIEIAPDMSYSK